jgi:hypothetical protein
MILRHFRTDKLYTVLHLARNSSDKQDVVVYQANRDGVIWVRPVEEFYDLMPIPGCTQTTPVSRFWPEED